MAYDNRNKYPQEGSSSSSSSVASGGGDTLKDRALEWLKVCKLDMDKLQQDRAKWFQYYMAGKLGNELEGRSQFVVSTVQDDIESIMPSMMRIFYSGAEVLHIRPQGPEDDVKCKLMEEKVNFDVQKGLTRINPENNGFKLLYTFIKDALLMKIAVVKYWYHKDVRFKARPPITLSEEEFYAFSQNPKIRIDNVLRRPITTNEGTGQADSAPGGGLGGVDSITYEVEYSEIKKFSAPYAENIPPDEFIFDVKGKSITSFCAHKKRIHRNKLRKYGLTEEEIREYDDKIERDQIFIERFADLGGINFISDRKDRNFRYIYECYLADYDEEGNEAPKIVTIYGDRVLREQDNSYGRPPFVYMSPIMIPHRIAGRGLAELLVEFQKLQSMFLRAVADNFMFQNLGVKVVNPFRIDAESLEFGNRPGGLVYTKMDCDPNTAIFPVPQTPLPPFTMNMFEFLQGMKENRTGVTRYNQGLDAKSLNRTATGISQIMGAAQQRIELIARIFAETGVRDLFQAFVDMNRDYFDMETALKVNTQWTKVRPEDIDGEFDVIIDVGIGTGSKEMSFQQKVQMFNLYGMIFKNLGPHASQAIFGIANIKNLIKNMWEDLGYKNTAEYIAPDQTTQMIMQKMMTGGEATDGQQQGAPGGYAQQGAGGGQAPPAPPPGGFLPPVSGGMPANMVGGGAG